MKKRTLLGSAVAFMAGAMLGAATPPSVATEQQRQVAEKSAGNGNGQQQQPRSSQSQQVKVRLSEIQDFAKALPIAYNGFSRQAKWCNAYGSGHTNKIKRSRNLRRKHRRA